MCNCYLCDQSASKPLFSMEEILERAVAALPAEVSPGCFSVDDGQVTLTEGVKDAAALFMNAQFAGQVLYAKLVKSSRKVMVIHPEIISEVWWMLDFNDGLTERVLLLEKTGIGTHNAIRKAVEELHGSPDYDFRDGFVYDGMKLNTLYAGGVSTGELYQLSATYVPFRRIPVIQHHWSW